MTPAKIPEGSPMTAQGLSAERLSEIQARLAAASPGPWHACGTGPREAVLTGIGPDTVEPRKHKNGACSCGFVWSVPTDAPVLEVTGGAWGDRYPAIRRNEDGTLEAFMERLDYGEIPHEQQAANMKFTAHAPTDISDLHREVTRLRAIADGLAALVKRGKSWAMTSAAHRQDRWGREDEDRYIAEADAALSTYDSDKGKSP